MHFRTFEICFLPRKMGFRGPRTFIFYRKKKKKQKKKSFAGPKSENVNIMLDVEYFLKPPTPLLGAKKRAKIQNIEKMEKPDFRTC